MEMDACGSIVRGGAGGRGERIWFGGIPLIS